MNPVAFPQCNTKFRPPSDLEEPQCMTIPGFVHEIKSGSCDGLTQIVMAWKPDERELEALKQGMPIFLSFIGGIPPHYPSVSFEEATRPA